jgi:hypothetical protein
VASAAVSFFNHPTVKNGVKDVISVTSFTLGAVEVFKKEKWFSASKDWEQTAQNIAMFCAKLSVFLSALTSRPGVYSCSWIADQLAIPEAFGPNTVFELNPRHPRHVLSIAASVLAIPTILKILFKNQSNSTEKAVCFNFFMGRPFLHVVNTFLLSSCK